MVMRQRKWVFVAGFGMATGVASYGCWLQGNKYFSSKERWRRLNHYIDNYTPVAIESLPL